MKHILSLLLAPTLALCGTFSGTVISLDGTPVVGAVIKAGTDSVTSSANGSWALARTTCIASRSGKTISVTSHLTVENGHPRLSFGGMDIRGRSLASGSPAVAKGGVEGRQAITARTSADRDTLRLYWKGKRLTVLPVPSDTGNVVFKIDTAWSDDAGIPWNSRIAFGSLIDARDGQTYRTVKIGNQTWMAENLNFAASSSFCLTSSADSCRKYGRLYGWNVVMQGKESSDASPSQVEGVCPSSWHVPSNAEWDSLVYGIGSDRRIGTNYVGSTLKSTFGWNDAGDEDDRFGFRALPGGDTNPSRIDGDHGHWWSSTEMNAAFAWYRSIESLYVNVDRSGMTKSNDFSLRCVKDTP